MISSIVHLVNLFKQTIVWSKVASENFLSLSCVWRLEANEPHHYLKSFFALIQGVLVFDEMIGKLFG
jgi:hypothetical protein